MLLAYVVLANPAPTMTEFFFLDLWGGFFENRLTLTRG